MQQRASQTTLISGFDKLITNPLEKILGAKLKGATALPVLILSLLGIGFIIVNFEQRSPIILAAILFIFLTSMRLLLRLKNEDPIFNLLLNSIIGLSYGVVLFSAYEHFDEIKWVIFIYLIVISYVLAAFTHYHKFKANAYPRYFFGWSDIVFLLIALLLFSLSESVLVFLQRPVIFDLNILDLILLLTAFILIISLALVIKRVPHITYGIWLFIIFLLVIAGFGQLYFTPLQLCFTLVLYAGIYISKLNVAIWFDSVERSTGLFTPIMVVVGYFMESFNATNTFIIITAYLVFSHLSLFYKSIKSLRK